MLKDRLILLNEHTKVAIQHSEKAAVKYTVNQLLDSYKKAVESHGFFALAVSGGSTPKPVYEYLVHHAEEIDWSKVKLFFVDERAVSADSPDSNYKRVMDTGFSKLTISQINRMKAESNIEENANAYEELLTKELNDGKLDCILLGMGTDGHTASLFPDTEGLKIENKCVIANYIPSKKAWRMTLSFPQICSSKKILFLVMGKPKAQIVKNVVVEHKPLPAYMVCQKSSSPIYWILDTLAGRLI